MRCEDFGGNYGPYRQSERRDIYKKYVNVLLDNGKLILLSIHGRTGGQA